MGSEDFRRTIEYVTIGKYKHVEIRDHGIRLYCTASPETHGADNARYALQIFSPLQRHDGSEGRDYMIATASLSRDDLVALRTEVDEAIAEINKLDTRLIELFNGSNLGPAERDPRTGNIEAGPVVQARTAAYTKKSRAASHARKARQSRVKKVRR